MEKMTTQEAATTRAGLYATTRDALEAAGFPTESIKGGALIDLGNGQYAKLAISICDATKFDLEATRAEYHAQVEARELAAKKAIEKAAEKARREAEKSNTEVSE